MPKMIPEASRNALQVALARRINSREETICALKGQTLERAADTLREALLQGKDLISVRRGLKHGQWQDWLANNCPGISTRTAQHYMRLAANAQKIGKLLEVGSIRQALAFLEERAEAAAQDGQTKQWPPYLEAMGRLSKLVGYVERFPVEQWPSEGLEKFREDLQPIAAKLWPEKFSLMRSPR